MPPYPPNRSGWFREACRSGPGDALASRQPSPKFLPHGCAALQTVPSEVQVANSPPKLVQAVGGTSLYHMTVGLTQDPNEIPPPEARESVSPETYLELARAADGHTPRAGVIPFVFDLLASAADVASIFERVVRKGGPMPQSKVVKDRVLRDLGYVLRNLVQIAAFFGHSLRDVIDADAARLMPDEPDKT